MKFASLKDGTRDGQLVLVSKDLAHCAPVSDIAPTLQAVLDDWDALLPALQVQSDALNGGGHAAARPFDQAKALAPLPRAFQWIDASAYLNHVELVRRARGATMPPVFLEEPIIYQGGSDTMLASRDPIAFPDEAWGIDFEAELVAVTTDVPFAADRTACLGAIKLLMLANDISLRNLIPAELAKGFGFFQSKPSTVFAPVAVTLDELGPDWDDGKADLAIDVTRSGESFGRLRSGVDMHFDFPDIMMYATKSRALGAGSIVGAGTVSNRSEESGFGCIAETRAVEMIDKGAPATPFLAFGETLKIEAFDRSGQSMFGAIDQHVERLDP